MLSLGDILITTLAAQIAVLPLLVINFGQLSLISPLANLLILPVIPLTMFFGFFATLAALIFLPLGEILGLISWLLLTYEIKVIKFLATMPLAVLKFRWTWFGGIFYYLILFCLVYYFRKKSKLIY